jgi:hypothetical protein
MNLKEFRWRTRGVAQAVEHLLCKCKAFIVQTPAPPKNNNNNLDGKEKNINGLDEATEGKNNIHLFPDVAGNERKSAIPKNVAVWVVFSGNCPVSDNQTF